MSCERQMVSQKRFFQSRWRRGPALWLPRARCPDATWRVWVHTLRGSQRAEPPLSIVRCVKVKCEHRLPPRMDEIPDMLLWCCRPSVCSEGADWRLVLEGFKSSVFCCPEGRRPQLQALCLQMEMPLLLFPLFLEEAQQHLQLWNRKRVSRTWEAVFQQRGCSSEMASSGVKMTLGAKRRVLGCSLIQRELGRQLDPENNTDLNAYNENSQNAGNLSVIPKGLRQTFSILGQN